jgi:hypothetical protein
MEKKWNKTYNQNGFNLENARKMELNAEDLMILRWFLDFYPLMEKVCNDNKEYGWVHYGYLLHNLQIIYCKEESVAKRFNRYCELGLIEKIVKNTTKGRKAYFRAVANITLLYTSHTDKNLDAHHDKNLDAHHDKNLDNSFTIYPSTINLNKDTASGLSQNENPVVKDYLQVQKPDRDNLSRTQKPKKEIEILEKNDIENFVRNFKANEFQVDGVIQKQSIFSENEIDLITEYIIRRKEFYKSKVKSTPQALVGILHGILETQGQFDLEIIFKQLDGIYVNCGTAGDKTKPFQTIKLSYFKHLQQKSTNNNNYAKPKMSTTSQVAEMLKAQSQYIKNNKQINYEQDEYPF